MSVSMVQRDMAGGEPANCVCVCACVCCVCVCVRVRVRVCVRVRARARARVQQAEYLGRSYTLPKIDNYFILNCDQVGASMFGVLHKE